MGTKWERTENDTELGVLSDNMNAMLEFADDFSARVNAVVDAVDDGSLEGKGYTAAKTLFEEYYQPISTALYDLVNDISDSINSYNTAKSGMAGINKINAEALIEQISKLETANTTLALEGHLPFSNDRLINQQIGGNRDKISALQKELGKLHDFDSATSNIFSKYEVILSNITKGIRFINAGLISSDGTFEPAHGASKAWRTDLENSTKFSPTEQNIEDFESAYGLDRGTAESVVTLDSKIIRYGKKHDWSPVKTNYEFAMVIASMIPDYHGMTWKTAAETIPKGELNKLMKKFGCSKSFISNIKAAINENHGNSKQNDFAHSMASLAVILNPNWQDHEFVSAGTMGDIQAAATYRADIASGSISSSDMRADIDALNIANRISRGAGTSVYTSYASSIANGGNRARELANTIGNGNETVGKDRVESMFEQSIIDPADLMQEKGNVSTKDDADKAVKEFDHEYHEK